MIRVPKSYDDYFGKSYDGNLGNHKYHRILFPEIEQQGNLFPLDSPCGNSIKKAYLCNSHCKRLSPGDNLFFYRSRDTSGITAMGIIEEWIRAEIPDTIAKYVGARTVYRYSQIERLCQNSPVLAIKFRFIKNIAPALSLQSLIENSVIKGQPQSISQIDNKGLEWLKNQIKK